MKRRILLCAGLLAVSFAAGATPGVDEPPLPGAPREVTLPPLHESKLPNGLSVVVAPRHALPLVSAVLVLQAGPQLDPPGRAGVAELASSLLAKGARRNGHAVGASQIAEQAEALGGTLDVGSGWRSASAGMTVATPQLDAALSLVADVVRRPLYQADELERLREQWIDGLRVAFERPEQLAAMAARHAFWGDGHAYGAITTPASLQRVTLADVRAFHQRHARPDRALLVLAGDITPDAGLALARRHFGDWRAPAAQQPTAPIKAGLPKGGWLQLIDLPGAGQSAVVVNAPYLALSAARSERAVGRVATALLGGGYSARLNQEVRVKRGLSYGASAGAESQPGGGLLSAAAQTNNTTAAQVLALMRAEVERIAGDEAQAAELDARKATLVGGFARGLETNGGVASLVASQWVNGRPLAELDRYVDETLAVTPAQVKAFAQKWWGPASLRAVIAGDLKAAGDSLPADAARADAKSFLQRVER